jgi:hypothetical protein
MAGRRHPAYLTSPLATIVGITIAPVICGADEWFDVEDYGYDKKAWIGQF